MSETASGTSGGFTVVALVVARVLVYLLYGVMLIAFGLLAMTFVLELLGASVASGFVQWVYRSVSVVMQPFRGIFPPVELNGERVLDLSVLFAMIIYGALTLALHALIEKLHSLLVKEQTAAARQAMTPVPRGLVPPAGSPADQADLNL
jgi:hypothetical protein